MKTYLFNASVILCAFFMPLFAACGSTHAASKTYSGSGGMQAYEISNEVYEYHYEHGFTGPDSMGWDPNLQYAWSRLGAAKTCGIAFSEKSAVEQLIKKYGHRKIVHTLNGIEFHYVHSKKNPKFCTPERVKELESVVPGFERGVFPEKY